MLLGIQLKYWQEIIITIYDFNSNLKKNKKTNKAQWNSTMWKINFKSNFSSKATYHILMFFSKLTRVSWFSSGTESLELFNPNKPSSSAHLLASNLTKSSEGFDSKRFALVGGWFQPNWKMLISQNENLPQVGVEINKYLSCHHLFLSFTHLVFLEDTSQVVLGLVFILLN